MKDGRFSTLTTRDGLANNLVRSIIETRDWVDAGSRREASYTNIPPGSYTFRVIASNNAGVWNETGTSFEFHLEPRFHQTYWFYALAAMLLALIGRDCTGFD